MKKTICITLILTVLLSFAGCLGYDREEIELIDRLSKIESYKAVSQSKLNVSAQIPDEIKDYLAPLSIDSYFRALSELEYISETEVTPETIKSVFTVNSATSTDKFVYYKTTAGENENNILLLPTSAKALLPEKYTQADYISFNGNSLVKIIESAAKDDAQNDAEQAAETLKRTFEIIGNSLSLYAMNTSLPENLVTKDGNTFKVCLDDAKLKSLAKSFADTYFENEQARASLDTAFNEISSLFGGDGTFGFESPEDMVAAKAHTDAFFALLDNVKIVSDDGINIVYTFDASGNIVKTETDINFAFDINLISTVFAGERLYEQPFTLNIGFKNSTNYTDVNKLTADKIVIPENSADKCVDIADWINEYINIIAEKNKSNYPDSPAIPKTDADKTEIVLPAPDGSVTVMEYGYPVDFGDYKPVNVDGTLYVPYEFLEINYDNCKISGKTITLNTYIAEYIFRVGSSEIDVKDYKIILSEPVIEINSHIYVPLRSTAKAIFGYDVKWDGQLRCAYLV